MDLKDFPSSIIIAHWPSLGWMPILLKNGKEVWRGEYQSSPADAAEIGALILQEIK